MKSELIEKIDLLAINADEAAAVAGIESDGRDA